MKKECDVCRMPFEAQKRSDKYCSLECRKEGRKQTLRKRRKRTACVRCGRPLGRDQKKYCSKDCANARDIGPEHRLVLRDPAETFTVEGLPWGRSAQCTPMEGLYA